MGVVLYINVRTQYYKRIFPLLFRGQAVDKRKIDFLLQYIRVSRFATLILYVMLIERGTFQTYPFVWIVCVAFS